MTHVTQKRFGIWQIGLCHDVQQRSHFTMVSIPRFVTSIGSFFPDTVIYVWKSTHAKCTIGNREFEQLSKYPTGNGSTLTHQTPESSNGNNHTQHAGGTGGQTDLSSTGTLTCSTHARTHTRTHIRKEGVHPCPSTLNLNCDYNYTGMNAGRNATLPYPRATRTVNSCLTATHIHSNTLQLREIIQLSLQSRP